MEPDSSITIINNSTDSLLWWIAFRNAEDTLLTEHSIFPDESTKEEFLLLPESKVQEKGAFNWALNYNREHLLMLFLFKSADVEKYPWDTIRMNYMVIRRYDLTREELEDMDWMIQYP